MRIALLLSLMLINLAAVRQGSMDQQVLSVLRSPHQMAVNEIRSLGQPAIVELSQIAFNKKWPLSTRWKAFMVMTQVQGKESIAKIKQAMMSQEWFMRSAALTSLQKIDSRAVKKWAAVKLNSDPALLVRMKAMEILSEDSSPKTIELFWKSLQSRFNRHKNKSLWIRNDVAQILARAPRSKDLKRWVKLLHSDDQNLQLTASLALGRLHKGAQQPVKQAVSYWQKRFPASKIK